MKKYDQLLNFYSGLWKPEVMVENLKATRGIDKLALSYYEPVN